MEKQNDTLIMLLFFLVIVIIIQYSKASANPMQLMFIPGQPGQGQPGQGQPGQGQPGQPEKKMNIN